MLQLFLQLITMNYIQARIIRSNETLLGMGGGGPYNLFKQRCMYLGHSMKITIVRIKLQFYYSFWELGPFELRMLGHILNTIVNRFYSARLLLNRCTECHDTLY